MSATAGKATPPAARDVAAGARIRTALEPAAERWQRDQARTLAHRSTNELLARLPWICAAACVPAWIARDFAGLPIWLVPMSLLGIVLLNAGWRFATQRWRATATEIVALACDRAAHTADRISAALELATEEAHRDRGNELYEGLARLAIADGAALSAQLDATKLEFSARTRPLVWMRAIGAAAILTILLWGLPSLDALSSNPEPNVESAPRGSSIRSVSDHPNRDRETVANDTRERAAETAPKDPPRATPGEKKDAERPQPEPTEAASAEAATGAGGRGAEEDPANEPSRGAPKPSPANASGNGNPGGGSGESSAGSAQSEPESEPKQNTNKPKPPRQQTPRTPRAPEESEQSAGTPSGASRGSGKMAPVANQRQNMQRSADRDDDPEVEEEEIDDETEEQEQRGGVMPLTRQDQRSPARELSISGDGPPDQGRGGPTPPKKSRGTASLVLGIRLPDQVRGQPNPGTAKTNLEETPPRRQERSLAPAAAARTTHAASAQRERPPQAHSSAWMRAYHELLERNERAPLVTPAPSKPSSNND